MHLSLSFGPSAGDGITYKVLYEFSWYFQDGKAAMRNRWHFLCGDMTQWSFMFVNWLEYVNFTYFTIILFPSNDFRMD